MKMKTTTTTTTKWRHGPPSKPNSAATETTSSSTTTCTTWHAGPTTSTSPGFGTRPSTERNKTSTGIESTSSDSSNGDNDNANVVGDNDNDNAGVRTTRTMRTMRIIRVQTRAIRRKAMGASPARDWIPSTGGHPPVPTGRAGSISLSLPPSDSSSSNNNETGMLPESSASASRCFRRATPHPRGAKTMLATPSTEKTPRLRISEAKPQFGPVMATATAAGSPGFPPSERAAAVVTPRMARTRTAKMTMTQNNSRRNKHRPTKKPFPKQRCAPFACARSRTARLLGTFRAVTTFTRIA
mmetsp:Transcript_5341/g.15507  ORF Transcript_5341/g.15507 Transcript_5341/m.15507 type:complete len:298 (-) Transcript_5341:296-1189(-)